MISLVAAACVFAACSDANRDVGDVSAGPDPVMAESDVDNSGRNVRDRGDRTLTPTDQSNSAPDVELTQTIRKGITSDDTMSMQARNIKVITQQGVVTLRGVVVSSEEKAAIEAISQRAGARRIDNQLEIDRDDAPGATE